VTPLVEYCLALRITPIKHDKGDALYDA
jgi:hypothetical protein